MLVKRTTEMETTKFQVGDIISFSLTDGEQVEAMAMKTEEDGTIFLLVDCLEKEEPMNKEWTNRGGYKASDLRKKLNNDILNRFPEEIRENMVAFDNGDLLRLPTEKEMFGVNEYGEEEPETVTQWEPMKLRRNRIAFRGLNGAWEWQWLQNKLKNSATNFAIVDSSGLCNYYGASDAFGVRPAFKIRNR